MTMGHVFVIEDDTALRASLADILAFAGYAVRDWPDAGAFLAELPELAPAVIVTDMRMPGLSGVELHATLQARGQAWPVIYISGESSLQEGIAAMKLGALDFLVKPFSRDALLRAVAAGLERDRAQRQQTAAGAELAAALTLLSPREREVHRLLLKGYSNAEITEALAISLPTAKQYKAEVLRKLGVRSLSQLIELGPAAGATE